MMKKVKKYTKQYNLDSEVVEKAVIDKKKSNDIMKTLQKIINEIPYSFRDDFTYIVISFQNIFIDTILETINEVKKSNKKISHQKVFNALCSKSVVSCQNALGVMRVKNIIVYMRKDKKYIPKDIPSIEINLTNAGKEKAERSIERILKGIGNGFFAKIHLSYDKKEKHCKKEEIEPFICFKITRKKIYLV